MLEPGHRPPGRFFTWFNGWFARVTRHYSDGVIWMLRHTGASASSFAAMVAVTAGLWKFTPGASCPTRTELASHRLPYSFRTVFVRSSAPTRSTQRGRGGHPRQSGERVVIACSPVSISWVAGTQERCDTSS